MSKRLFYGTMLAAVVVGAALAAPKPAILQRPGLWTATVRFEHPQQIVVGQGRYWYMILSVTNRTGRDVEFHPKCDLLTDTFQIVPATRRVPAAVFQQIQQRHAAAYPFLELLDRTDSRLLQGEDNAKDVAIIWPDFDLQASSFRVFVSGLSNETVMVPHPVAVDQTGQPVQIFLRKTLELSYSLHGDPAIRPAVEAVYESQSWVMR